MTVPRVRSIETRAAVSFAASPLLANIGPDDLKALIRQARERAWRAGQVLFQRGDAGDGIYAIVSGEVRIVIEGQNGAEVMVRHLRTGDVFGELSALDGSPRSATALAATSVRALHVSPDRFRAWVTERPGVALPMLSHLAYRLRTTNEQVAEMGLLDVETRIARRLWQRLAEASGGEPQVGARTHINQTRLAAELGVTRESVNKHLSRWKSQGVLEIDRGEVVLRENAALRRIAGTL